MPHSSHKYKLTLSYDGTHFGGWQIQPNAPTIQETLQEVWHTLLKEKTSITGAGRTDAGVHARAQTAHFSTENPLDLPSFLRSVNALLPFQIRVTKIEEVSPDFHARYSATSKIYHYHLGLEKYQSPFTRLYTLHVKHKIDLENLKRAAFHLIGTHAFTSFANEAHTGSAARNPVRTLKRVDILEEQGGLRLELEGDGFLYKMVRNIVGTLLEVAAGKRSPDEIPSILEAQDRKKAGKAAPPHGLFLHQVIY